MQLILILILSEQEFNLLKNQDKGLFCRIFHENKKDIYNFLVIKTRGNFDIANDILSETFLSAYDSAPGLKQNKNLKNWLLTIAVRRLNDYWRKLSVENKYHGIYNDIASPPEDFDETIHKKQKKMLFSMGYKRLNPQYQNIFKMKYQEKKSIKDIASILGKDETFVQNMINRAKTAIKKEMMQIAGDFFREGM